MNVININLTILVCNSKCTKYCFNKDEFSCTCELSSGNFWLRRGPDTVNSGSLRTYCQGKNSYLKKLEILNIDYSTYNTVTLGTIKKSTTQEWTMEFWAYAYIYNQNNIVFTTFEMYWDLHSRVSLYNNINAFTVKCYSLGDKSNPARYNEFTTQSYTYNSWNIVRCGTNLLKKKYFFNQVQNTLTTTDIPNMDNIANVSLQMGLVTGAPTNWGFLFIRNMKLWQQYNFGLIDTSYM